MTDKKYGAKEGQGNELKLCGKVKSLWWILGFTLGKKGTEGNYQGREKQNSGGTELPIPLERIVGVVILEYTS